jgi:transposase
VAKFKNQAGEKTQTGKQRKRGRKSNDVRFEATGPLFRALGVDLTKIEGIEVGTALIILAEIGVDVSRFPTEKHFASWLRLCPTQDQSNKTKRRRGHRQGKSRVANALRLAAQSVGRTMTPLGMYYRRIRGRAGGRGAVKATAHKLACLIYRMLKHGEEYVVQSMEEYEVKMKANVLRALERKAAAMGFQLSPMPTQ